MNAMIDHYNNRGGRTVYVSNGTFTLPAGINRFRVTLCGGGGRGHAAVDVGFGEDSTVLAGGEGGDAPMISAVISGYDAGTAFNVTIGAGGTSGTPTGGTTSFGTLMSSAGGQIGGTPTGVWYDAVVPKGNPGAATFPPGAPTVFHDNDHYCRYIFHFGIIRGFGKGGRGGAGIKGYGGTYESLHSPGPEDGSPGVCVVEW
jgi:hypothetical protein